MITPSWRDASLGTERALSFTRGLATRVSRAQTSRSSFVSSLSSARRDRQRSLRTLGSGNEEVRHMDPTPILIAAIIIAALLVLNVLRPLVK